MNRASCVIAAICHAAASRRNSASSSIRVAASVKNLARFLLEAIVFGGGSSKLADDAKPALLKVYLERFGAAVGQHFPISASADLSAFADIASRYPVFKLQAL